VRKADDLPPS